MLEWHYELPGALRARVVSSKEPDLLQLQSHVPGLQPAESYKADIDIEQNKGEYAADLPHLLYAMARHLWIRRGIYPVHAACVVKGQRVILLAGPSGSGKTRLAQRLVDTQGYKLHSGNKTLVRFEADGQLSAIARTQIMTALDAQLQRHAYKLPSHQYAADPVIIHGIILCRLNDGVKEADHLSPLSALHTLYPPFMDAVNADVICNGAQLVSGAVPDTCRQQLVDGLVAGLHSIPVHKYSGSLDFLAEKVGAA